MNINTSLLILLSLTLGAGVCAHSSGTDPHDMSAADHDVAAADEESEVSEHEVQHNPNAQVAQEPAN